jgi:lambda family phage portal protein
MNRAQTLIHNARRAWQVLTRGAGYEAGAAGRRWRNTSEMANPPSAALAGRAIIMRRSRGAYANQAYARAIVDCWASTSIGTGIKPTSKAPENAAAIDASFSKWWDRCDADELTDFGGLQAALFRSMVLTGDGFASMTANDRGELQIRLFSSEQVASVSSDLANGRWIIDGIEFDAELRRAAIHVYRNPPGLPMAQPSLETIRFSIEDSVHMFRQDHIGVVRGVGWLSPILLRLTDLDGVSDALGMRAKTSALFCAFITQADGGMLGTEDPKGEVTMEPATVMNLRPGESINFAQSPQIGAEMPEFLKGVIRECASGSGTPYEIISNDLSNANYSSRRGSMTEFRRRVEQVQYAVVIPQLRKIWRRSLTLEILGGGIDAPGFEADPDARLDCGWLPPKFAAVDPLKDCQADLLQMGAGLRSRRELVAERGRDLEELDAELARDNASAKALGLEFVTATNTPQQQPQQEAAP